MSAMPVLAHFLSTPRNSSSENASRKIGYVACRTLRFRCEQKFAISKFKFDAIAMWLNLTPSRCGFRFVNRKFASIRLARCAALTRSTTQQAEQQPPSPSLAPRHPANARHTVTFVANSKCATFAFAMLATRSTRSTRFGRAGTTSTTHNRTKQK